MIVTLLLILYCLFLFLQNFANTYMYTLGGEFVSKLCYLITYNLYLNRESAVPPDFEQTFCKMNQS